MCRNISRIYAPPNPTYKNERTSIQASKRGLTPYRALIIIVSENTSAEKLIRTNTRKFTKPTQCDETVIKTEPQCSADSFTYIGFNEGNFSISYRRKPQTV